MYQPINPVGIVPQKIPYLKPRQTPTLLSASYGNLLIRAINWCLGLRVGYGLQLKNSEHGPFIELAGAANSDQTNNEAPLIRWRGEYDQAAAYEVGDVVIVGSNNYVSDGVGHPLYYAALEDGLKAGTYILIRPMAIPANVPWEPISKYWATFARGQWDILCRRKYGSVDNISEWVDELEIKYKQTRGTHTVEICVDDAIHEDLELNIAFRTYKYSIQVGGVCKTLYFQALGSLPWDPDTGTFYDPLTGSVTTQ